MLTRLLRSTLLAAAAVALAAVPAAAAPMLTIQLTPTPVVGAPGQTVDVFAEIANAPVSDGSEDVTEFIGVSGNGPVDVGSFVGTSSDLFLLGPPALAAGTSLGPVLLGTFTFANDAVVGSFASFRVDVSYLYGDDLFGSDFADFRAVVAAPEPTTIALIGLGLVGAMRRRRRA